MRLTTTRQNQTGCLLVFGIGLLVVSAAFLWPVFLLAAIIGLPIFVTVKVVRHRRSVRGNR